MPTYYPTIIAVRQNDSTMETFVIPLGEIFDIAFDFSAMLASGETVSTKTWATLDSNLVLVSSILSTPVTTARFDNEMLLGIQSLAYCSVVTSLGRVLVRYFTIVSDPGKAGTTPVGGGMFELKLYHGIVGVE